MNFGTDSLNNIADQILNRKLPYEDTIIIGDNSSGKSLLLKILVEKAGEVNEIYFIDAVNRGFDVTKVRGEKKPEYKRNIVVTRISDEFFNLKDSFNCYGTLSERIEQFYYTYEEKVQNLFEQLTQERFRICKENIMEEVEFSKGKGLLSSGYQAIIRILMEFSYYYEKCMLEKEIKKALVVVDELDEFLSPAYSSKIFQFLKKAFPGINLAITTHSCDLVAGASNVNLIILGESGYEVVDGNDYSTVSEVQIIFGRVFGENVVSNSETEKLLRRLLNNKLNKVWNNENQLQLEELQKECLTASQKLIWKQIAEW